MLVREIELLIKRTLEKLDLPQVEVEVERPADEVYGDYATNAALMMFQRLKKNEKVGPGPANGGTRRNSKADSSLAGPTLKTNYKSPKDLAEGIAKELRKDLPKFIEEVRVAGPGFINFKLSDEYLINEMVRVLNKKDDYGRGSEIKNKKIMLEFTDPNPFKQFHIGHLYTNNIGESLARLFEAQGAEVKRANYQGDVGLHVAKAVWGLGRKLAEDKLGLKDLEKRSLGERVGYLGEAYALGANAYEEREQAKAEIEEINKKIYKKDPEIEELYQAGRSWSLEDFERIYKRLGTKFDFYYFEREAGAIGLKIVLENLKKGVFEESQGALVFPGEKYGLHTRVFVNSYGLPTYEAKDLGLAITKYKDFKYHLSVIVTGNEVDEYFRVILEALGKIEPELALKTKHIGHGMVKLPGGKMSSRTGKIITGEWLLDEAKRRVLGLIKYPDSMSEKEIEEMCEKVGMAAVRYGLLKSNIGKDIRFDFEESISFEGNSGPYLQYTYARCRSVLKKAGEEADIPQYSGFPQVARVGRDDKAALKSLAALSNKLNKEEMSVLRWLHRFPEVVKQSAVEFAPNLICTYLYELAQRFNRFYNQYTILGKQVKQKTSKGKMKREAGIMNQELRDFRLALTASVAQVLENGLFLLGIKAPERM